jgi:uridine phosphorylase
LKSNHHPSGLLTPEAIIAWKKARGLLQVPVTPRTIILSTQGHLIKSKQKLIGNKWLKGIMGKHLCIDTNSGTYLSTGWGIGSPGMIATCEEFRVLGATSFYLAGIAGRLTEDIHEGEMVVATTALSEEGTSRHYYGNRDQAVPCSEKMLSQLNEFHSCKFVSTDAPYRETAEMVSQWRSAGTAMVDMETSALYSFAKYYGVDACSIAVGADALTNDGWRMPRDMHGIFVKQVEALNKILKVTKA